MAIPRVTVIVPAYNAEKWLGDCLRSIRDQTYADWVCKVYDDGSTDKTRDIAKRFTEADPRFVLIEDKTNVGTPRRVAQAYSEVSSEFFCQVDADDVIAPDAVETLLEVLSGCYKEVGVVYSDYSKITADGEVVHDDKHFKNRCRTVFSLKRMQTLGFCAFQFRLIRTAAYRDSLGVDGSVPTGEDFDLVLKLAETCQFVHVRRRLYFYRQHDAQTSRTRTHLLEHTCKRLMEESRDRVSNPSCVVVVPYTGVDDAYALRKWTQHKTDGAMILVVVTDLLNDPDVIECKEYANHRVEVIPLREDPETDYAALASRMAKGVPAFELPEAFVPSPGVVDDMLAGNSVRVVTLEPRTSWLLQSGIIQSYVVKSLDEDSTESVGDGPPGQSALYRMTREKFNAP